MTAPGDFHFVRVALAPLDLLRRRPVAALGLALTGTLVSVGGRVAVVVNSHYWLSTFGASRVTGPLLAALAMALVVGLVIAIVGAAIVRDQASDAGRGLRLSLGGDEARLFVLWLLIVPAALIVLLVMLVAAGVAGSSGEQALDGWMWSGMAVGVLATFWLASRLWLAGPMAVQEGRIGLRKAWRLTATRRGKVFGLYMLAMTAALLVGVGANIGLSRLAQAVPVLNWSTFGAWDFVLKSAFQPVQLAFLLLQGLLFGLGIILQATTSAALYRALAGDRALELAAAFD
ncbi:hypothetical protein [Caulobacter sp. DWR2-3-1b2]|uniref:hypothetical protein n=1 Tax=unclassified Caulobacter TaxID=2648921 RepID=UPI003CF43DDB